MSRSTVVTTAATTRPRRVAAILRDALDALDGGGVRRWRAALVRQIRTAGDAEAPQQQKACRLAADTKQLSAALTAKQRRISTHLADLTSEFRGAPQVFADGARVIDWLATLRANLEKKNQARIRACGRLDRRYYAITRRRVGQWGPEVTTAMQAVYARAKARLAALGVVKHSTVEQYVGLLCVAAGALPAGAANDVVKLGTLWRKRLARAPTAHTASLADVATSRDRQLVLAAPTCFVPALRPPRQTLDRGPIWAERIAHAKRLSRRHSDRSGH